MKEKESEQPAEDAQDDSHDDDPMANYRPRAPDEASLAWWDRDEREWPEEEKLLAAGAYKTDLLTGGAFNPFAGES